MGEALPEAEGLGRVREGCVTTPTAQYVAIERGVLVIFEEPQTCPKCGVARCVWLNASSGETSCFICSEPPKPGETTSTGAR